MSVSPLMAEASVDRGLCVEEFAKVEGLMEVVRA
jgi:hypothetical protein